MRLLNSGQLRKKKPSFSFTPIYTDGPFDSFIDKKK